MSGTMIDSGVFLGVLLVEPLWTENCKQAIENNQPICITPTIIKEVITKIEEKSKYDGATIKENSKKISEKDFQANLMNFYDLIKNAELLIPKKKKDYNKIFKQSQKLQLGKSANSIDKINLSIAIAEECSKFITTDTYINEEKNKIKKISGNGMEIKLINK